MPDNNNNNQAGNQTDKQNDKWSSMDEDRKQKEAQAMGAQQPVKEMETDDEEEA